MSLKLLVAALVSAAALVGTALAATPEKVVASKTVTGGFAMARTTATVQNPAAIRVKVFSSPRQSVIVTWRLTCTKGTKTRRTSKQYPPVITPTARAVPLSLVAPGRCTIVATGQLDKGEGRVTTSILASRR